MGKLRVWTKSAAAGGNHRCRTCNSTQLLATVNNSAVMASNKVQRGGETEYSAIGSSTRSRSAAGTNRDPGAESPSLVEGLSSTFGVEFHAGHRLRQPETGVGSASFMPLAVSPTKTNLSRKASGESCRATPPCRKFAESVLAVRRTGSVRDNRAARRSGMPGWLWWRVGPATPVGGGIDHFQQRQGQT